MFEKRTTRTGTQGKENSEKGAVWHQDGEIRPVIWARSLVSHVGVHKVGPGYAFRNVNSL